MTLDDIPADTQMILTAELRRLFLAGGCNPTCHGCNRRLAIGDDFTLATMDGRDEMIGTCCTKEKLRARRERQHAKKERDAREYAAYKLVHPGYSRPSKQRL